MNMAAGLRNRRVLICESLETRHLPTTTFTVTNTDNEGDGSLRHAIIQANSTEGTDVIKFAIPGEGIKRINLLWHLPEITDSVTVDGTTQPGFAGAPLIEISGALFEWGGAGLTVRAADTTLRSIAITDFTSGGFSAGVRIENAPNCVVEGCYIGIAASGQEAALNKFGIYLVNSPGCRIGGTTPATRNLFASGEGAALTVGGSDCVIVGNYFGLNATGDQSFWRPNHGEIVIFGARTRLGGPTLAEGNVILGGVEVAGFGSVENPGPIDSIIQNNIIGLDASGTRALDTYGHGLHIANAQRVHVVSNVISGMGTGNSNSVGIVIRGGSSDITVQGNWIGTDRSGTLDLGSDAAGILVGENTRRILIGGRSSGEGNVIAFNGWTVSPFVGCGVGVYGAGFGTSQVEIVGNRIFGNGGLAIDLGVDGYTRNDFGDVDDGENQKQNFPMLFDAAEEALGTVVAGSLDSRADAEYRIDFYADTARATGGTIQAATFLGTIVVRTDDSGAAGFRATLPVWGFGGQFIRATATDADGNTSELSSSVFVPVPPPVFVQFESETSWVDEGAGVARLRLTRTGLERPVSVRYATMAGTATSPADFVAQAGVVRFAVGVNEAIVEIPIVGDDADEPDESFVVQLTGLDDGATFGDATRVDVHIRDDDEPPPLVHPLSATGIYRKGKLTAIRIGLSASIDVKTMPLKDVFVMTGAGKDKRHGTKDDYFVRLKAAAYSEALHRITVRLKRARVVIRPLHLLFNGSLAFGESGLAIDADRNGTAGGIGALRVAKRSVRWL